MKRTQVLGWLVWSLLLAACHTYGAGAPRSQMQPGRESARADTRNGLVADPASNPPAGAFFNDGRDGDVRARSENAFGFARKAGDPSGDPGTAAPAPATERMLVYQGEIRVEVARPDDAARDLLAKVREWGGYLQRQTGTRVVVRLPAGRFDEAFALVRSMGRVLGESRQADDVTEEFVDLGIRLDTARKSRDRLLEVLAKAEKVEDILKVEAELRRLTEEIERMEGRRKFLADQVAMATLAVDLQATAAAPPPPPRSRQWSRFEWINRVGAESMMGDF